MMFFRRYRSEVLIALAALAIAAAWLPIRMRFPFDDTYITFRYAANLAHGFGIVWNPGGAHTEGYTNFLFVLLLVPFSRLGWDLVIVSQVISVVAVMVSAVAIYRIVDGRGQRRWAGLGINMPVGDADRANAVGPYGFFAVAFFLLDPFTWLNAFSGMETSLFTMWLLLVIVAIDRPRWAFIFATLAALTRPEGAMVGGVVFLVAIFWQRTKVTEGIERTFMPFTSLWPLVRGSLYYFVFPLVVYALWKLWYFGNLLPNSFYVKVGQVNGGTFLPGRGTMRIFYTGVWYLLPLGLIAVWRRRKNAAVQIAVLWCGLLSTFYLFSVLIQNEYQRFTNSIEVMLFVLVGLSIGAAPNMVPSDSTAGSPKARRRLSIALAVLLAFHIYATLDIRGGLGYIERTNEATSSYPHLAEVFRSIPDHEEITLAWGDAGRLPYYSGMRSIDPVGLNTNEIAHTRTGDEVVNDVIRAKPDLLIIPLVYSRDLPPDWNRSGDAPRMVLPHGQGLIGSAYSVLARAALSGTYKPIFMTPQPIYDLDILCDTLSPHYRDIVNTLASRIGRDTNFLPPALNVK